MAKFIASQPPASLVDQGATAYTRGKAAPLVWVWLLSYALLALLNIWLWEARGVMSGELIWLEAQRRLVADITPPDLAALIQTSRPLLLYIVLLAGSALNGAALLGATAVTLLAWRLRVADAPWIWLPLLVLQPALLLALTQQPSALARAILIVIALTALYGYLRENATYQALIGALALGALIIAETQPWPLLVALAFLLVLVERRPWRHHVTVLLITLFPAVCMTLSWGYLRLVEGSAPTATEVDLLGTQLDLTSASMLLLIASGITACVAWVCAAMQLFKKRPNPRLAGRARLALILLLALPLVDLLSATSEIWLLSATLPLMALPLLAQPLRRAPIAQGSIGTLLVVGLLVGWGALEQSQGEPHQLFAQALGQPTQSPLQPYRAVANQLNTRLAPGQRVLIDSDQLPMLIPLVHNADALLVPQQHEYALALQEPTRWASFIVITDDDSSGIELSDYQLLLRQDGLSLYQKTPPNKETADEYGN